MTAYTHTLMASFTERYLLYSCKFTEMAKVLQTGTQSYHSFTFGGIQGLISQAKLMNQYHLNTTVSISSFITQATAYNLLADQMLSNLDKVSYSSQTYRYVPIPGVNSSTNYYSDYLAVSSV